MRSLNLPGLTVFVAIVEHGSFAAAARHLGLSTPSVSQALRGLEERLGVRLLNRTTRSVTLTEAGGALLAQVRPALDQLQGAIEAVNVFRDRPAGTLRLAANGLAADAVVLPVTRKEVAESLVAFVVLVERGQESEFELGTRLKAELAQRVPVYMLPRKIIFCDAFPITANGKTDRRKLAASIA